MFIGHIVGDEIVQDRVGLFNLYKALLHARNAAELAGQEDIAKELKRLRGIVQQRMAEAAKG